MSESRRSVMVIGVPPGAPADQAHQLPRLALRGRDARPYPVNEFQFAGSGNGLVAIGGAADRRSHFRSRRRTGGPAREVLRSTG